MNSYRAVQELNGKRWKTAKLYLIWGDERPSVNLIIHKEQSQSAGLDIIMIHINDILVSSCEFWESRKHSTPNEVISLCRCCMCRIQRTVKSWIYSLEVTTAYSCVLGQMDRNTRGFGVPGQVLNALKSHLDQVSDHQEQKV